jgi:hypothetical protein
MRLVLPPDAEADRQAKRHALSDFLMYPPGACRYIYSSKDRATAGSWRRGLFVFYTALALLLALAANW